MMVVYSKKIHGCQIPIEISVVKNWNCFTSQNLRNCWRLKNEALLGPSAIKLRQGK